VSEVKVIGYCRVSTQEQAIEGVSIEAQEAKIRAYCLACGLDLVEVILDGGLSGTTLDRPGLKRVLQMISDRQVGGVVVTKLDRLSRKVIDTLAMIEEIERSGAGLHSIAERVDTKSAFGRFLITILAALAEMERGLISERTSAALQHKVSIGEHVGRVPFGFRVDPSTKRLIPHVTESRVVKEALSLRDAGLTLWQIAKHFNDRGISAQKGGIWRASTVSSLIAHGSFIST
jgi:DNA invertase Pin-like site-specific DNA recombinase